MDSRYRKTTAGECVVFGPVDELTIAAQRGSHVWVATRDGSHSPVYLARVGRPFIVDEVSMSYGYIDESATRRHGATEDGASRCTSCPCHRQGGAGQPGTILFDGCDRCECEAA